MLGWVPFDAYGHTIWIKKGRTVIPYPVRWPFVGVRIYIAAVTWDVWQAFYEPIAKVTVAEWDDLTYEDMWRNTEVGLRFCRAIGLAQRG